MHSLSYFSFADASVTDYGPEADAGCGPGYHGSGCSPCHGCGRSCFWQHGSEVYSWLCFALCFSTRCCALYSACYSSSGCASGCACHCDLCLRSRCMNGHTCDSFLLTFRWCGTCRGYRCDPCPGACHLSCQGASDSATCCALLSGETLQQVLPHCGGTLRQGRRTVGLAQECHDGLAEDH